MTEERRQSTTHGEILILSCVPEDLVSMPSNRSLARSQRCSHKPAPLSPLVSSRCPLGTRLIDSMTTKKRGNKQRAPMKSCSEKGAFLRAVPGSRGNGSQKFAREPRESNVQTASTKYGRAIPRTSIHRGKFLFKLQPALLNERLALPTSQQQYRAENYLRKTQIPLLNKQSRIEGILNTPILFALDMEVERVDFCSSNCNYNFKRALRGTCYNFNKSPDTPTAL